MATSLSDITIPAIEELTPYHAKYFAHELTRRCPSNSLDKLTASLVDAQVDLNPHQVDAALFTFQSPLSKGAILADEVGLGKTIEAGIVLSQKWAERQRRILIIVPANLRNQWNQELQEKFYLPSIILENQSFNQTIKAGNLNPFEQSKIIICSYQFAKAKEAYIKQVQWDLVVIDEAHRLRNVYKPSNKIANTIKSALEHSPKILLTATPLQNNLMELFGLVSLIDEHAFGDIKSFKSQFARLTNDDHYEDLRERLRPICQRTLRRQVKEYISYTNRHALVQQFTPSPEEQRLYELVTDYLRSDQLYALPSGQRSLMTLILRKLLASSTYAITGTLEGLANKLENILKEEASSAQMIELEDNFEAYREYEDEYEWLEDNTAPPEQRAPLSSEDLQNIKAECTELRQFATLAASIQKNSKGEVLLQALENGFQEATRMGAPRKAIIFTESTRTQSYIKRILENSHYKGKIVLFNGKNSDPETVAIYRQWMEKYKGTDKISGSKTSDIRAALVDYFRNQAEIMIATEAAAEGINLQFCSLVVNYDLPWNPQRIEQRIGRCHRYGQKFDVVVVNFLNINNAADQRVYELLDAKFRLFNGVFGSSDEVLGSIESGVDFEKRIIEIYQQCRSETEIQTAFDSLQAELEEQINQKMRRTRQHLLENFDEEVHEKLRINLQKSRENIGKYEKRLWSITRFRLMPHADFNDLDYSFHLKTNPFSMVEIPLGQYCLGKKSENAHVYRTAHPLAEQIIDHCKTIELPISELIFDYTGTPNTKISILEPFVNESGWLTIQSMTIESFESEDYLILSGISDSGNVLDAEECCRMFSLPALSSPISKSPSEKETQTLQERCNSQAAQFIEENSQRNAEFFEAEITKLDKWSEDRKNSLEIELKDLEKEIKTFKTEARKLSKLEDKVKMQRQVKDMEKQRSTKRLDLYEAQDKVDKEKEILLETIEARLYQKTHQTELFTIRWKVV